MSAVLTNYASGQWITPSDDFIQQYNAVTGDEIYQVNGSNWDFESMIDYGRKVGNTNLRKLTFFERGMLLKKLALHLNSIKKKYYPISYMTGATKSDSWIDIDGGIGTMFAYASLRKQFSSQPFHVEAEAAALSREGTFIGHHILVPKRGVAVHINAFNFPVWGMLEKCAPAWLAGMPCIVKAAEPTSFLTHAVVKDIIDSGILPKGALQLVCGSGIGILDHLDFQDVATFTGSASTGKKLKQLPNIIDNSVPFNMEADSLNASVLGLNAAPGTPEFDLFVKEVRKEMTVKCGQKCTAIRRILVPEQYVGAVKQALVSQLEQMVIGNPENETVRMGSLVSRDQLQEVTKSIETLAQETELLYDGNQHLDPVDGDKTKGAFIAPALLYNAGPFVNLSTHEVEAFGPVSTIIPYKTMDEAVELVHMGKGSLVSSIVTFDDNEARQFVYGAASHNGRILVLNRESAKESTGHGAVMPLLTHGGPGRAGGGEELGGVRGVKHYLQRCAIQGTPTTVTAVTQVYQQSAKPTESQIHPFRKYYEDLQVGDTVITHNHTVTEADITNFANVSGDNFYAHMDATSLEGTMFDRTVAHGYFVLSKAAGLFVDPAKGPVLLNYGLESCRFTKPVYPGMTIGVRFSVKEKLEQEKREDEVAKGIVKFLVDVYDETGETVAIATILTMVKKKNQG